MRQIEDRMLQVCYEDRLVGTMVLTADRKAALNIVMNGWKMDFQSALFRCR